MEPRPQPNKSLLLVLLFSFVVLALLLSAMAEFMTPKTGGPSEAADLFFGLSCAACVASVAVVWVGMERKTPVGETAAPMPLPLFQTRMLVALAFAEQPALLGFVATQGKSDSIWLFTALSLVPMFGFVLPKVLARLREPD